MADKEKYVIKIQGQLVEVSPGSLLCLFSYGAAGALAGGETTGTRGYVL